MKSNPSKYNPVKQDFIAKAISSTTGGFHPSKTDLTARYSVKSITLFRGDCFVYKLYFEITRLISYIFTPNTPALRRIA